MADYPIWSLRALMHCLIKSDEPRIANALSPGYFNALNDMKNQKQARPGTY